jgi:hypothetical protein
MPGVQAVKLTKKQRAEVVELLRCAFDQGSLFAACVELDRLDLENEAHLAAWNVIAGNRTVVWLDAYLEAAARVEEGSWP